MDAGFLDGPPGLENRLDARRSGGGSVNVSGARRKLDELDGEGCWGTEAASGVTTYAANRSLRDARRPSVPLGPARGTGAG